MEIIATGLGILGLVVLATALLIFTWIAQKELSKRRKAAKKNYERNQVLERIGIDPLSGEQIRDYVSLEKATFLKDEKYLLAQCGDGLIKRVKETGLPIKLGYFKKERWTVGLPFYLFFCPACNMPTVDYKHSYDSAPHLTCQECEINIPFSYFGVTNPENLAKFPVGS